MYIRRSPIWPDPRAKPPFGAAEIDWTHAQAWGLLGCWLFNERGGAVIHNMVDGRSSATTVNAPVWSSSAVGPAMTWTAASSQYAVGDASFPAVNTAPGGLIFRGRLANVASNYHMGCGRADGSGLDWEVQVTPAGHHSLALNGGEWAPGTTLLTAGPWFDLAYTFYSDAGDFHEAFLNGQPDGGPSAGHVGWPAATGVFEIGRRPTNAFYWDGDIAHIYFFNRRLTRSDVLWLTAEPYAFLRPIVRRRWSVPPQPAYSSPFPSHRSVA